MNWIKSVINGIAKPYTPARPGFKVDEEVMVVPRIECPDSAVPKNKDWFQEIPESQQSKLINLTIAEPTQIDSCDLLNSLRFAKSLKFLNLVDISLTSGFRQKMTLPELTEFQLSTVEDIHGANFLDFFPFNTKNGSAWKVSDIANLGINMNIMNGAKFLLRPQEGTLFIQRLDIADEVLSGLGPDLKWRDVTLSGVNVSIHSIPAALNSLVLYDVTLTDASLSDVLQKTKKLSHLSISLKEGEEIKTSDLPLATLKVLRLDRVNLTHKALGYFDSSYDTFEKLDVLILSVGTVLDKTTKDGFLDIFKTCKRIGYYAANDFTLIKKIFQLKDLQFLMLHVEHSKDNKEVNEFFKSYDRDGDAIKYARFDKNINGTDFNLTVIDSSNYEREFSSYLNYPPTL